VDLTGTSASDMDGDAAFRTVLQEFNQQADAQQPTYNELGESGLAIAVALQSEHCKLTDLNLESNKLGAEARLAITAALPSANV
jgi:hypothetical protein